jgi:hypothetical protein
MRLDLAPAGVIRAAAWPIETLDVFGDSDLADASRKGHSIDTDYDAVIDRERASLWERTAGDPRFMKALLLASPSLFDRVRQYQGLLGHRSKNIRHLETALYRYLARAASRPTPNQLWAGVVHASFGSDEKIATAAPVAHFDPDLKPFALALSALGQRDPYREAGRWRLSPTLRRQPDGAWRFLARPFGGGVDLRQIGHNADLDRYLRGLGDAGTATLRDLSVRANVPSDILGRLAEGGALVGGLSFPTRFASAWEALELAGDSLLADDRTAWKRGKSSLAELSETLARDFDRMAASHMVEVMERARFVVEELFAALDVKVEVPRSPFRCDLKLPFHITLGTATRRQLQDNINAYQREWIDQLSPSSSERRERRRALAKALSIAPVPLGNPLPEIPPRQHAGLDSWAATFHSSSEEVILGGESFHDPTCSAPWGSLIAQFGPSGIARVIGIDDSPIRLFGRHSSLLGLGNEAERWVQELFSRLRAECGVQVGDLAIPFEGNPNVLAGPSLAHLLVEPWGAEGIDLHGADLRTQAGAILLHTPSAGWITSISCSSAYGLGGDPLAAGIAWSGFDEPMDPNFRATSQNAPGEDESLHYAPRLVLSSGAAIRPRRTSLAGALLEELTRLPRKARYRHWRKVAERLGWPERVALSFDGGPPLTIPSSSPLAVEAAFQGASRTRRIVIEEGAAAWLPGTEGHHIAEIVVPFSRTPHAFSALGK